MGTKLTETPNAAQAAWLKANKIEYIYDEFSVIFKKGTRELEVLINAQGAPQGNDFYQVVRYTRRGRGVAWVDEFDTLKGALKALAASGR